MQSAPDDVSIEFPIPHFTFAIYWYATKLNLVHKHSCYRCIRQALLPKKPDLPPPLGESDVRDGNVWVFETVTVHGTGDEKNEGGTEYKWSFFS